MTPRRGTDINMDATIAVFTQFINSFVDPASPPTPKYLRLLEQVRSFPIPSHPITDDLPCRDVFDVDRYYIWSIFPAQIRVTREMWLELDCGDLHAFDADLYDKLVKYPREMIPIFDLAINKIYTTVTEHADVDAVIQVDGAIILIAQMTGAGPHTQPQGFRQHARAESRR